MGVRSIIPFLLVGVVGCMSGGPMPWETQTQPTYAPRTAPTPTVTSPQAVRADQEKQATAILDRAQAIQTTADNAVQTDGSPQASQVRQMVRGCRGNADVCIQAMKSVEAQSRVGALAGLAGYLTQPVASWIFSRSQGVNLPLNLQPILAAGPNLDLAEKAANKAMEEAQKVADANALKQKQLNDEMAQIETATTACTPSGTCGAKCNAGDGFSCVPAAVKLWKSSPPRLTEARAAMQKGCDAGVQRACNGVPQIDAEVQQAAAQVNGLWADVTDAGDDLAGKYHMVSNVTKMAASSPRLARDVQKMIVINQAIVNERYCPAKKAFLAGSNAAEFAKRAADHCKNSAPTGQGLSGAEVTLTAECQQVYGTACP
jgi:hypothetical protein